MFILGVGFMNDENKKASRNVNIKLTENKLEAYISIFYTPDEKAAYPPKFTALELKNELSKAGIVFGIIEDNIKSCTDELRVDNILAAKGESSVPEEDDILDIKFEVDKDIKNLNEDSKGRVDFKSIGAVNSVLKGAILAVRIPGKEGRTGKDVTGKQIMPKPGKKIKLKVSQGCELLNENTVVASIDGKPSMRSNTFYVNKTHEVSQDVDMKTGNIMFLGDITVKGSVREGMKVYSGSGISVVQNVERAEIKAKGDIIIKGSVIASSILGGGEDAEKLKEIEDLKELKKSIKEMIAAIEEIKKFNLLGYNTSDGQIIKLLLESKFKTVPKVCLMILSQSVKSRQSGDTGGEKILTLLKNKLIGLAPLNIKHYSEIFEILDATSERLEVIKASLSIPVNVKLSYCQDAEVSSSGDIIVSGRGVYVSSFTAHHSIYFTQTGSAVRGGSLKAGNEIKAKVVGSHGGAITKLSVGEKGHIWVDTAFENTVLVVGNREMVVEYPIKNVHAYLDHNLDLIVDRLKL
jgi:uncharacterized protein (DUF342 family)